MLRSRPENIKSTYFDHAKKFILKKWKNRFLECGDQAVNWSIDSLIHCLFYQFGIDRLINWLIDWLFSVEFTRETAHTRLTAPRRPYEISLFKGCWQMSFTFPRHHRPGRTSKPDHALPFRFSFRGCPPKLSRTIWPPATDPPNNRHSAAIRELPVAPWDCYWSSGSVWQQAASTETRRGGESLLWRKKSINQSIHHSVVQQINPSINQSINQAITLCYQTWWTTKQAINQSIDPWIDRWISGSKRKQSFNQWWGSPALDRSTKHPFYLQNSEVPLGTSSGVNPTVCHSNVLNRGLL